MSDNEESYHQSNIEPIAELELFSQDPQVEFELDPQDVRRIFEEFGTVKSVTILKRNIAKVKMTSFKEMQDAITFLNFKKLKSLA